MCTLSRPLFDSTSWYSKVMLQKSEHIVIIMILQHTHTHTRRVENIVTKLRFAIDIIFHRKQQRGRNHGKRVDVKTVKLDLRMNMGNKNVVCNYFPENNRIRLHQIRKTKFILFHFFLLNGPIYLTYWITNFLTNERKKEINIRAHQQNKTISQILI